MRATAAAALGISLAVHAAAAGGFVLLGRERPRHDDPAPQLAGETFELPAPEPEGAPLANASPAIDQTGEQAAPEAADAPARTKPPPRGKHAARPSHEGRPSAGRAAGQADGTAGAPGATALYGAVGERSAADLATAFTRAFPQAASGDASWRSAPFGAAGEADLTLTIDDEGHLVDAQVAGSPSAPLAAGIRRTLALIKGRPFVARGKTTKLHLVASVSADSVHDGLHGDVFAIGGSFASGEGSAFFALAIGRRIDLRVRLR